MLCEDRTKQDGAGQSHYEDNIYLFGKADSYAHQKLSLENSLQDRAIDVEEAHPNCIKPAQKELIETVIG